jgi:hypothetical protein
MPYFFAISPRSLVFFLFPCLLVPRGWIWSLNQGKQKPLSIDTSLERHLPLSFEKEETANEFYIQTLRLGLE